MVEKAEKAVMQMGKKYGQMWKKSCRAYVSFSWVWVRAGVNKSSA